MKRIPLLVLFVSLFFLTSCNSSSEDNYTVKVTSNLSSSSELVTTTSKVETEKKQETKHLPETESGNGVFYLSGTGGDTKDGHVLTIFDDGETQIMQLGVNTEGFDGAHLSYIYIDGVLVDKQQLGSSQSSLNIKGEQLKKGPHKVNVVQYETDLEDGVIITNKIGNYEIN